MKNLILLMCIITLYSCTKGDTEAKYQIRTINFITGKPVKGLELCTTFGPPKQCRTTMDDGIAEFIFDADIVYENPLDLIKVRLENYQSNYTFFDASIYLGNSNQIKEVNVYPKLFFKTTIDQTNDVKHIYIWGVPIMNDDIVFDKIIEFFINAESTTENIDIINYIKTRNGLITREYTVDSIVMNFNVLLNSGDRYTIIDTVNMTLSDTTKYYLHL